MPENVFKKIRSRIEPNLYVCFLCSIVFGLIAHFYKLTNFLPNWDSLVFRYDAQNMLHVGRWFLSPACAISSYYDLPWVNGLLTILFHAFGAVCVCKVMRLKGKTASGIVGAIIVTFPTVTSILMYNYVADGYALSFLFACAAAMLMTDEKRTLLKFASSVVLISLSVAIYQAYITVTVMLVLLRLIDDTVFGDKKPTELIKNSGACLAAGLSGLVIYYIMTKLTLFLSGTQLVEYQGISDSMSLSAIDIKTAVYICTHSFVEYFLDFERGLSLFGIINCLVAAAVAVLFFWSAIKNGIFRSLPKLLITAVLVIALPFGASALAFINSTVDYHCLMKMGYCVFYLLLVILYERMDFLGKRAACTKSWTILVLCSLLVYNHILIANISYHKLDIAWQKSYGVLMRITDRIEQTPGADGCDEIAVVGELPGSRAYSSFIFPEMTGTTDSFILRADDETIGQSVLCSALNDYCGKNYKFVHGERKRKLLETDAVKNMKAWSDESSVAVVDGVIVIKLGEEPDCLKEEVK